MTELAKYFEYKCWIGLKARGLDHLPEYQDRLKYEMGVINSMNFPGYFLIQQDFINWAKSQNIYVGPGRGSAAGSLASYSMGITNLDPIRWGLLFERFLNPSRISMPDIDVDFEKRYRERVIEYAIDKYGEDRVAHIGTYGSMKAKGAVRSVCKTLGHPYAIGDRLSKLLLADIQGKAQKISTSLEKIKELRELYEVGGVETDILNWAIKIEGGISNAGVHASGIVVSNEPLVHKVPLFKGRSGEITTQCEMNNIERVGLIKFDFLGLDALEKIHRCVDFVKERHGIDINIDQISLEDDQVFANLQEGDTAGIFQLEASSGIKDMLVQIRPICLEDLIAIVAIYRPGPLSNPYLHTYLAIRAGHQEVEYLVPELESILKPTQGWLIFQEQAMAIAKKLCGYDGGEADNLRKAIGKKKADLMATHESKFKAGWAKNGLPVSAGNIMWDQVCAFAAYSFNKSHAAAYAYVTYQTAWLKTYYPHEYLCAMMTCEADNRDDIIKCITESKRLGIKILPPDINSSSNSFNVNADNEILFGLAPVKNLGASVDLILEDRQLAGPFKGLRDFCERVDTGKVNKKKVESLILAGAFDRFGQRKRASLIETVELIWEYRDKMKAYKSKLETYEKKMIAFEQRTSDIEQGVLSPTNKKLKSLKDPVLPEEPMFPEIAEVDEMSDEDMRNAEHELLGFYVSSHPLDGLAISEIQEKLNVISDLKHMENKMHVSLAMVVTKYDEITTQSRKKMAFVAFEDLTGSIDSICFAKTYEKFKLYLDSNKPLKVDGIIDMTEVEDKKVVKLKISRIAILDIKEVNQRQTLSIEVPIKKYKDLINLISKYAGDFHKIKITFVAENEMHIKVPKVFMIGDCKGAFDRDLTRIKDEAK